MSLFYALFFTFSGDTSFCEELWDVKCLLQNTFSGLFLFLLSLQSWWIGRLSQRTEALTRNTPVKNTHIPHIFLFFQLFWKQQLFLFPAGQCGNPRHCAKRQRPNHGDQDEENDWIPPVSEMRISGQEIRHIKMEFCHHATEAVLEVRRVHWHFTPSLGFSELWKMSYWEGETKQKNSLMPFGKMESSFQNSLSQCHIHVEQSESGWAASWKEDWATITNHITMGQQWEVNLCSERVKGCLKRGCLKACVLMLMFPNYPGELIYLTAKVINLLSLSLCRCYRC